MLRWRRFVAGATGLGLVAGVSAVAVATPAVAAPTRASATAESVVSGGQGFHSLVPARVLDTRTGLGAPAAPVGPGQSIDVQLTGLAGIPTSGVAAVVFNLTAVSPTTGGFLSAYPAGTVRPTASTLNFVSGQTVANEVIATLGTSGKVTIYNNAGNTHVLADISGWFATDSYYTGLTPARVLDTRAGVGAPKAPVGPGQSIDIQVTGHNGIPTTGAAAVAVNITATAPTAQTYITAYPTGDARPGTSNLNLDAGQTTAVLAVTKLGTDGKITLYNNSGNTQLIADITGWFTTTGQYTPLIPARVLDTRPDSTPFTAGQTRTVDVAGPDGDSRIPTTAGSVVLSVTAVAPTASGFLTVYPSGTTRPAVSTVNYTAGHTVSNLVIVRLTAGSTPVTSVNIYNGAGGDTHVLVDVLGWFVAPLSFSPPLVSSEPTVPAPYEYAMTAFGGVTPYTWTVDAGTLPDGLTLASTGPQSGAIAGTPTTAGRSSFTVRVTDASGMFENRVLVLDVQPFVSGAAWYWGAQGGNGFVNLTSETFVPERVSDLSGATAIAATNNGAYALRSDGTVWAWSQDAEGSSTTPVQVTGLTGVTAVAAASGTFLEDGTGYALTSNGNVWAWGDNTFGQLGNGTTTNSTTPVQVQGLTGVTAIAGGTTSGYALTSDGSVWAWGDNTFGQLGNGTTTNSTTPVQVQGLTGVTAIAGGASVGYAISSDGGAWAWGLNSQGQLGNGTTTESATPVQVTGLTGVTAIAGGNANSYALTSDGTVLAWGLGKFGNLGTGQFGVSTVPLKVARMPLATALSARAYWAFILGTI